MKPINYPIILIIFAAVLSCKEEGREKASHTAAILGQNPINYGAPFLDIEKHGTIQVAENTCNATLISSNTVILALHCIKEDPLAYVGLKFKPLKGEQSRVIDAYLVDDKKDSVIYVLDTDYPKYYSLGILELGEPIYMRGIEFGPGKEQGAIYEVNCRAVSLQPEYASFTHDCDTKVGFSGSAIIQNDKVVGLHHGYNSALNLNIGVDFGLLFEEEGDIVKLSATNDEIVQECCGHFRTPHTRAPHARTPHVRTPHVRAPHVRTPKWFIDQVNGLKKSVKRLTEQRNKLKVSVDGLKHTLRDLDSTLNGRNESVKDQLEVIQDLGKHIDKQRRDIQDKTAKVTGLDGAISATKANIGSLNKGISNTSKAIVHVVDDTSKVLVDNAVTRTAISNIDGMRKSTQKNIKKANEQILKVKESSEKIISKNTSNLEEIGSKISGSIENIGKETSDALQKLKKDISVKNAEKLLKSSKEFIFSAIQENLLDWISDRLENGSVGEKMTFRRASVGGFKKPTLFERTIFVSSNNGWVEEALNWVMSKTKVYVDISFYESPTDERKSQVCIGSVIGICLDRPAESLRELQGTAGMVCERELWDAVSSGATGLHWVNVSAAEFCRLKTRHHSNRLPRNFADVLDGDIYKRSVKKAMCESRWAVSKLFTLKQTTNTYRCVDLRPLLRQLKDKVAREKLQLEDKYREDLQPKIQQLSDQIEARIRSELNSAQTKKDLIEKRGGKIKPEIKSHYPQFMSKEYDIGKIVKKASKFLNDSMEEYEDLCINKKASINDCEKSFEKIRSILRLFGLAIDVIYTQYPKLSQNAYDLEGLVGEYSSYLSLTYPHFTRRDFGTYWQKDLKKNVDIPMLKVLVKAGQLESENAFDAVTLYNDKESTLKNAVLKLEKQISDYKNMDGVKHLILLGLSQFPDKENILKVGKDGIFVRVSNIESENEVLSLYYLKIRLEKDLAILKVFAEGRE